VELALGTVQFGLPYGVAGAGEPISDGEARAILARAWSLGIRTLDTAPAYGDIEQRLTALTGGAAFSVVTKLPALPDGLAGAQLGPWLAESLERSFLRLNGRVSAVLFHRAEDLMGPRGTHAWEGAARITAARGVRLGVSCYDAQTLASLQTRFPLELAQLPGNAFDQGLLGWRTGGQTPIHLRSAFLQGLLLLPQEVAARKVPAAASAIGRWHAWCRDRGLAPLQAALSIVKALPGASHCVVGVDQARQLEEIAAAWHAARPLAAPELASVDPEVIDPRRWPARETA
jgi:aryl-alcohol dehydrogenase-like predicted oxidoreductase